MSSVKRKTSDQSSLSVPAKRVRKPSQKAQEAQDISRPSTKRKAVVVDSSDEALHENSRATSPIPSSTAGSASAIVIEESDVNDDTGDEKGSQDDKTEEASDAELGTILTRSKKSTLAH